MGLNKKLDIGIDVDGVLRDTFKGIAKAYFLKGGHKLYSLKDFKDYDFTKLMNIDDKKKFFINNAKTIFYDTPKKKHTNYLNEIAEENNIHIITSQFKGLEGLTLEWLHKNRIPYDSINFTWDKSLIDVDIMLDDLPYNLKKFNGDTIGVCYTAPYNYLGWEGLRVNNMKEFSKLIKDINTIEKVYETKKT